MVDNATLQSIPSLRSHKSPSPRLTPRRSIRGRQPQHQYQFHENNEHNVDDGGLGFSLSRRMDGLENNHPEASTAMLESKPFISCAGSSIMTSPLSSSKKKKKPQQKQGNQTTTTTTLCPPLSPSSTYIANTNLATTTISSPMPPPLVQRHSPTITYTIDPSNHHGVDDEPLTPRNLLSTTDEDESAANANKYNDVVMITLTPPVTAPAPLVVAAKRAGSKVRPNYSTKRRRPRRPRTTRNSISGANGGASGCANGSCNYDSSSSSDEDDSMKIPEGLSPTQRAQEYWKRCYGTNSTNLEVLRKQESWSARRAAPTKSCLSHSKPNRTVPVHARILMPTAVSLMQSPTPSTFPPQHPSNTANHTSSQGFSTPRGSPEDDTNAITHKCSHSKSVQFGVAQAAEYDLDAPSAKLTPLPAAFAQMRYSLDMKDGTEHEEEDIAETKDNSAVLAEWDDAFDFDFDEYSNDDNDDDDNENHNHTHSQSDSKKCHYKPSFSKRSHRKHTHSSGLRNSRSKRSERRRSSVFSAPGQAKALYDPAGGVEEDETSPWSLQESTGSNDMDLVGLSVESPHQPSPSDSMMCSEESLSLKEDAADDLAMTKPAANLVLEVKDAIANSFCKAAAENSDVEQWDSQNVFGNLMEAPISLWKANKKKSQNSLLLESAALSWHASVNQPFENCLAALSKKVAAVSPSSDKHEQQEQLEDVPSVIWEQFERKAQHEWNLFEKQFCRELSKSIEDCKEAMAKAAHLVEYLDFPCEASAGPTQTHTRAVEKDILALETAIAEQTVTKESMAYCQTVANLQLSTTNVLFATLSYRALSFLSPFGVAMTHQGTHAIVQHLKDGVETRIDLDSRNSVVSQVASDGLEVGHDIMTKWYTGMLSENVGQLQAGFHKLLSGTEDVEDFLLCLSTVIGRVDLAALSLRDIAELHDVSVESVVEYGQPAVVIQIELPENMQVNVFYSRNDPVSVFWSMPSKIHVERDGKVVDVFGREKFQHSHSGAHGSILGHICRQVQGL